MALIHPAGDGDQQESEWVKDSLDLQSPLSRAQSYSWEQSQIQADTVFGPFAVAVKRLAGKGSSLSISHAEAKSLIRAAAERAVVHISSYSAWIIQGPVEMTIEYYAKEKPPAVYKGQTVLEAYEAWLGK